MLNPTITKGGGDSHETFLREGACLSRHPQGPLVPGKHHHRPLSDRTMTWRTETFTGYTAQIIQHEIDHRNGVLV